MRKRRIPQREKDYWFAQQEETGTRFKPPKSNTNLSSYHHGAAGMYIHREQHRRRLDQSKNPTGEKKEKHVGVGINGCAADGYGILGCEARNHPLGEAERSEYLDHRLEARVVEGRSIHGSMSNLLLCSLPACACGRWRDKAALFFFLFFLA